MGNKGADASPDVALHNCYFGLCVFPSVYSSPGPLIVLLDDGLDVALHVGAGMSPLRVSSRGLY